MWCIFRFLHALWGLYLSKKFHYDFNLAKCMNYLSFDNSWTDPVWVIYDNKISFIMIIMNHQIFDHLWNLLGFSNVKK
jgi:hypothetical protein